MSFATVNDVDARSEHSELPGPQTDNLPRQSYKSWKKKYNKMRHNFKDTMNTNNSLFEEEHKLNKVARRLQEHNDQLIDILTTINESRRLPPSLHYDIGSPTPSVSAVPPLEKDLPQKSNYGSIKSALNEASAEYQSGAISLEHYREVVTSLRASLGPPKLFSDLLNTPHTSLSVVSHDDLPIEIRDDPLTGYLSPSHEEEYLAAFDAAVDGGRPAVDSHPIRGPDKGSDAALKNPISVYNWLRKNQPQVFLQDADASNGNEQVVPGMSAPEKGTPAPGTAKKSKASKTVEEEVLDDDGNVLNATPMSTRGNGRGKRKREDDAYRPKGGTGRSTRKRTSTGKGLTESQS